LYSFTVSSFFQKTLFLLLDALWEQKKT
jgi:hypothetical protein